MNTLFPDAQPFGVRQAPYLKSETDNLLLLHHFSSTFTVFARRSKNLRTPGNGRYGSPQSGTTLTASGRYGQIIPSPYRPSSPYRPLPDVLPLRVDCYKNRKINEWVYSNFLIRIHHLKSYNYVKNVSSIYVIRRIAAGRMQ
jgi:hypothetical protein